MQGLGTKGHEKVSPWELKDKLGGLWATPGHVLGGIIVFGPGNFFLEWTYLSLIFLFSASICYSVVFCGFPFLHQHFQSLE